MYENKRCENCEGCGQVTRWGWYGDEVPYVRVYQYPNDTPRTERDGDGEKRTCSVCNGNGSIAYDERPLL